MREVGRAKPRGHCHKTRRIRRRAPVIFHHPALDRNPAAPFP